MGSASREMVTPIAAMIGMLHLNMWRMTSVRDLLSSSPMLTDISILETTSMAPGIVQNRPMNELAVENADTPAEPAYTGMIALRIRALAVWYPSLMAPGKPVFSMWTKSAPFTPLRRNFIMALFLK